MVYLGKKPKANNKKNRYKNSNSHWEYNYCIEWCTGVVCGIIKEVVQMLQREITTLLYTHITRTHLTCGVKLVNSIK